MFKRILSLIVIVSFFLTTLGPLPKAHADPGLNLPTPGTMVDLSPAYEPAMIKGLTIHKDNPFLFDFIVDTGNSGLKNNDLKNEGDRLIRYFLACLTIPEKDLWVNLSPYEKDRMVPQALGQTALGRDLLAEDYILKQLTASLIYPEKDLGKAFWDRVYSKARLMYGTTKIPVNTFNKVWIMADRATVYEHGQTVFVLDGHLKVMLEEDYLALQKHTVILSAAKDLNKINSIRDSSASPQNDDRNNIVSPLALRNNVASIGANIVRQIILPEIEKEVNTGKNFSTLRQIFNSLILASWYKKNLKEALLSQVYADRSTVNGVIASGAKQSREQIYEQYLKAYKKGVFNYIKEDAQAGGQTIPRKYFSGGFLVNVNGLAFKDVSNDEPIARAMITKAFVAALYVFSALLNPHPAEAQKENVNLSRGLKSYSISSPNNNVGMDSDQLEEAVRHLHKIFHKSNGLIKILPGGTSLRIKIMAGGYSGISNLPNVVRIDTNGNTLRVTVLEDQKRVTRTFIYSGNSFYELFDHAMVEPLMAGDEQIGTIPIYPERQKFSVLEPLYEGRIGPAYPSNYQTYGPKEIRIFLDAVLNCARQLASSVNGRVLLEVTYFYEEMAVYIDQQHGENNLLEIQSAGNEYSYYVDAAMSAKGRLYKRQEKGVKRRGTFDWKIHKGAWRSRDTARNRKFRAQNGTQEQEVSTPRKARLPVLTVKDFVRLPEISQTVPQMAVNGHYRLPDRIASGRIIPATYDENLKARVIGYLNEGEVIQNLVRTYLSYDQTDPGILQKIRHTLARLPGFNMQSAQWLLDAAWLSAAHNLSRGDFEFLRGNLMHINSSESPNISSAGGWAYSEGQRIAISKDATLLWHRWEMIEKPYTEFDFHGFALVNLLLSPLPRVDDPKFGVYAESMWRAGDEDTIAERMSLDKRVFGGRYDAVNAFLHGQTDDTYNAYYHWLDQTAWLIVRHKLGNLIGELGFRFKLEKLVDAQHRPLSREQIAAIANDATILEERQNLEDRRKVENLDEQAVNFKIYLLGQLLSTAAPSAAMVVIPATENTEVLERVKGYVEAYRKKRHYPEKVTELVMQSIQHNGSFGILHQILFELKNLLHNGSANQKDEWPWQAQWLIDAVWLTAAFDLNENDMEFLANNLDNILVHGDFESSSDIKLDSYIIAEAAGLISYWWNLPLVGSVSHDELIGVNDRLEELLSTGALSAAMISREALRMVRLINSSNLAGERQNIRFSDIDGFYNQNKDELLRNKAGLKDLLMDNSLEYASHRQVVALVIERIPEMYGYFTDPLIAKISNGPMRDQISYVRNACIVTLSLIGDRNADLTGRIRVAFSKLSDASPRVINALKRWNPIGSIEAQRLIEIMRKTDLEDKAYLLSPYFDVEKFVHNHSPDLLNNINGMREILNDNREEMDPYRQVLVHAIAYLPSLYEEFTDLLIRKITPNDVQRDPVENIRKAIISTLSVIGNENHLLLPRIQRAFRVLPGDDSNIAAAIQYREWLKLSAAMMSKKIKKATAAVTNFALLTATRRGGIDLNTSNGMQWTDSKDGKGVEMIIDPAMNMSNYFDNEKLGDVITRVRRQGIKSLSPDIFKITPLASIWPLAGLPSSAVK